MCLVFVCRARLVFGGWWFCHGDVCICVFGGGYYYQAYASGTRVCVVIGCCWVVDWDIRSENKQVSFIVVRRTIT